MAVADPTGRRLAEALTSADVPFSGEIYEVRPPTVREAIEISATAAAVGAGEDHVRSLVIRCETWLPPALLSHLVELDVAVFIRVIRDLLRLHADKAVPAAKRNDGSDGSGGTTAKRANRDTDFRLLLADYCQIYGGDPWQVYDNTPWPFFLAMVAVQSHASARELLRLSEIEILPHTGKKAKEGVESLHRRAEGPGVAANPNAEPETEPTEPETAPMEVVLASRARLRRAIATGRV